MRQAYRTAAESALGEWSAAFNTFLNEPGLWEYLVAWARACRCLPVYCDWTHVIGVTEHGTIMVFQHEDWPRKSGPPDGELTDLRLVNVALYDGMKRYAWLRSLLPIRPVDAQECSMCNGTGQLPAFAPDVPNEFACYCGGAGWVPATDTWVNKERFKVEAKK